MRKLYAKFSFFTLPILYNVRKGKKLFIRSIKFCQNENKDVLKNRKKGQGTRGNEGIKRILGKDMEYAMEMVYNGIYKHIGSFMTYL